MELRKFLKTDRFKEWADLDMQWIRHHNPDLVILDGERVVERIDLNGYSEARVEKLLESKGFKRRM